MLVVSEAGWAMWWMLMDLVGVTQAQALLPCRICQSRRMMTRRRVMKRYRYRRGGSCVACSCSMLFYMNWQAACWPSFYAWSCMICMFTFKGYQLPHVATTLGFVVLLGMPGWAFAQWRLLHVQLRGRSVSPRTPHLCITCAAKAIIF